MTLPTWVCVVPQVNGNGEGESEEEVRDDALVSVGGELDPEIEESVEQNTGKYKEPAPDDSSLDRILNPSHYQVNNQGDVDIPGYHGSANSAGDLQ